MIPRGRKRELRGDLRQRRLIDALVEELESGKSFAALSINDLTRRAGLSRPGFYFYFQSKEEVLLAALSEGREQLFEVARSLEDARGRKPLDLVKETLGRAIRIRRQHQPLQRAFAEAAATHPEIWAFLEDTVEAMVGPLSALVVRLRAERKRPISEAAAQRLVRALLWANERNVHRAIVGSLSSREWAELTETLSTIWTCSILGDPDSHA
jgi:AcrR family transcriptional regulator